MYLIDILRWKTLPAQGFEPAKVQPASSSLQPHLQYRANQIALKWKFLINCFSSDSQDFFISAIELVGTGVLKLIMLDEFFSIEKKSQNSGFVAEDRKDPATDDSNFELWARPGSSSGRAQAMPELILNLDEALLNL